MTFPQVATSSNGSTSLDTTHTYTLPSGISSGDLIIGIACADGSVAITWPNSGTPDWPKLVSGVGTNQTTDVVYRIASGSEGSTINVTTSGSEETSYAFYRITGWHGTTIPEATSDATSDDSPNPPSETASWGSEDNLWITAAAWNDGRTSISAFPTNYASNQINQFPGASNPGGTGVGLATDEVATNTQDPGVFTLDSSEQWTAVTIVVRPAAGGGETAAVTPLAIDVTVVAVTATHAEVRTASVSPLATTITPTTTTATYVQVETAAVAPLPVTLTPPAVTATYVQVETAAVAPLPVTITPPAVTAVGSQTGTAAVTPLALAVTVASVTATYVQVETAAVAPVVVNVTPTATTATGATSGTASVTPLAITVSVVSVTATYIQVETAAVAPLAATITVTSLTATYVQVETAAVAPLSTLFTIPAVTATGSQVETAAVAPLPVTLTPPAVAATYVQVETAAVVPLLVVLTLVSVTAGTGQEFDFTNTSVGFDVANSMIFEIDNNVLFETDNTVSIIE